MKRGLLWLALAPEPGTNLSLLRKGLRAGGEIAVALEKGLSITGRVTAPAGATQVNVHAYAAGMNVQGKAEPDGRYELSGLPEGTRWSVSAGARIGEDWLSGRAPGEVPAGSSIDLEVKKQ